MAYINLPPYLLTDASAARIHRHVRASQMNELREHADALGVVLPVDLDLDSPETEGRLLALLYGVFGARWSAVAINPDEWSSIPDLLGLSRLDAPPPLACPPAEIRLVEVVWTQGWIVRLVEIRPGETRRFRLAGPLADRASALVGAFGWAAAQALAAQTPAAPPVPAVEPAEAVSE